ncbi:MAG: hypothetical protein AAF585_23175 [Verrucomicrobiota bacterium]
MNPTPLPKSKRMRAAWILFSISVALPILGFVIGVVWFFNLVAESPNGGQGMSGIILMFAAMAGAAAGMIIGSVMNVIAIVLASRALKRAEGTRGGAITAIVLNSILALAGIGIIGVTLLMWIGSVS